MIFSDIGIFANIYRCHRVSMNRLSIPRDALVLVGDGQKALFLRNIDDEKSPNLTTERVFTDMNPPTREQGTDRPGPGLRAQVVPAAVAWK
jgi:protein required for attachment to host cells